MYISFATGEPCAFSHTLTYAWVRTGYKMTDYTSFFLLEILFQR